MKHKTTIVIPVYNEGENICSALTAIHRDVRGDYVVAVVYDDESDTTLPALDRWENENGGQVWRLRNRYGRGALNAIRTGLEKADSEYVVVTMADLSDPPSVINDMVRKADAEQADIVCGSRYIRGGRQIGGPFLKGLLSYCAGWSLYVLAGLPTHDPTNSFKLYRKSFLNQMTVESTGGFELGLELVVKACNQGYKVTEVPTTWIDRVQGKSNFKLCKWLPSYLHWYFAALRGEDDRSNRGGLIRFGAIVLFLLFLLMHIPDPRPLFASLESGGLDASWVRILSYAHQNHLQFGRDVIFTYGPLGYLLFPFDPAVMCISTLLSLALLLPFGVVFIRKKSVADLIFLLLFTIVSISYYPAYEVFVFLFPMLIWYILEEKNPWVRYGGIVYCAVAGAFCVFIKFMCAPVMVFSLLIADILMLKRRKIVLATPTFLLFLPLIWCFPARQSLANLGAFFVYSWHIATGYGYAMAWSEVSPRWIALIAASSIAIFLIALSASGKKDFCHSALERICYVLLPIPILFVIYKYGVGRMDSAHIVLSVGYLSMVAVFFSVDPRMSLKWRCSLLAIFMLLEGSLLYVFSTQFTYLYLYPYWYSTFLLTVFLSVLLIYVMKKYAIGNIACRALLIALLAVFVLWSVRGFYWPRIKQVRQYFAAHLPDKPVPAAGAAAPATPTADCFSHDIRPLLGSKMKYSPRLVFQSYSAYTPRLLRKNASHFEYDAGPDYIFYDGQELDGILPSAFDSLALLQLMNNYEPVPGQKLLRKKIHRPAAAGLTEVRTVSSKFNRKIDLPQDSAYTWVAIEIRDSLFGRLLKNAVRPSDVTIRLVLDDKRVVTHKIIPENCGVPFLLSPYLPSWAGLESLFDTRRNKLPKVESFSVHSAFHLQSEHWRRKIGKMFFRRKIVVHFYRMGSAPEKTTTP